MRTWIRNGHMIDPSQKLDETADLLIEDGIIRQIGTAGDVVADETIDATGLYVMPGFIDLHVHFRDPGFEYKETIATGAAAAARGGYTTVCPMPNTMPVTDSAEKVAALLERAESESVVHILPVGAVTLGQEGKELADIAEMAGAGAAAVSEDGKSVMDTLLYREGMKEAEKAGIPVFAHCEDKQLVDGGVMNAGKKAEELGFKGITNAVEDVIAARDIFMAKETGAQLHLCHCSTSDSVELVRMAVKQNLPVTAEVCPHHFTLCEGDIPGDDANYKMNPPLRKKEDVEALKKALQEGVISVISTDHAPHSEEEKAQSIATSPFGIVGLETAFALGVTELVKTGILTLSQLVEKMSMNPAAVLGRNIGTLAPGTAADIVLVELEEKYVIDKDRFASKGKNTPFHGREVYGRVCRTIVDGKTVYRYTA